MIYVPAGYSNKLVFESEELFGGSQYGAGTITNPTAGRPISKKEFEFAEHHGSHFAKIVGQYVAGKK